MTRAHLVPGEDNGFGFDTSTVVRFGQVRAAEALERQTSPLRAWHLPQTVHSKGRLCQQKVNDANER